jgi:hypothetical protein
MIDAGFRFFWGTRPANAGIGGRRSVLDFPMFTNNSDLEAIGRLARLGV